MEFLKKHYEKLVLGIVLLGLAGAAGYLPFKVASDKETLSQLTQSATHPREKLLTNQDLTITQQALQRAAVAGSLDFGAPNKLFNPMPWQQTPDRQLIPGSKVGPKALIVTNIQPLWFRLTLKDVTTSDTGPRYIIGIEKQVTKIRKEAYCSLTPSPTKNDTFALVEVKGKADDIEAAQVVVLLNDTKENVTITKAKPYERIDGYMADFRYEPEKGFWATRRVGAVLPFNGEQYRVVAINQNEAVVSAPNQKKWTVLAHVNPSPPSATN